MGLLGHRAIYDGPVAHVTFKSSPLIWDWRFHVRHPKGFYGPFFEGVLLG